MDSSLIDRLAKSLSDRSHRRGAVKLFAGTGLAAIAARLRIDQAEAKKNKKKKRKAKTRRCSNLAAERKRRKKKAEPCRKITESCSERNECCDAQGICGEPARPVSCEQPFTPECAEKFSGRRCCGLLGFPCSDDCGCCGPFSCVAGECSDTCRETQESCRENDDCCHFPEDVCATNSCGVKDVCCSLFDSICSDDCDCCVPFTCDPDLNQCVSPSCLPPTVPCRDGDQVSCCQEGETCCTDGPSPKCCPTGTACTAEGCQPPCPQNTNACAPGAEVPCGEGPLFAGCKCYRVGEFSFCARPTRCIACQDDPDCRGQGGHPAALCIPCPLCLPPDPPTMCVVPCVV